MYDIIEVNIKDVKAGDLILFNNEIKTVNKKDIHFSEFMGISIFGDNFKCGHKLVKKIINYRGF